MLPFNTTILAINVMRDHISTNLMEFVPHVDPIRCMTRLNRIVLVAISPKVFFGTTKLVLYVFILTILISRITPVISVLVIKPLTLILKYAKIVL